MANNGFINALPIFDSSFLNEKNISFIFPIDFDKSADKLIVTGENEYQIFLNGVLIGYGPARSAKNIHQIDTYQLKNLKDKNRLLIILASHNTNTFEFINQPAFIQFELFNNDKSIIHSDTNSISYLYQCRIQKVCRFSFQRPFIEAYNDEFDGRLYNYGYYPNYRRGVLKTIKYGSLVEREVHYPDLKTVPLTLLEKNDFKLDQTKERKDFNYLRFDFLELIPIEEWEIDINKTLSQLVIKNKIPLSNEVHKEESLAYRYLNSVTGFINLSIKVKTPSHFIVHFDEINLSTKSVLIDCFRNTTENYISYDLKVGEYELTSFSPYTLQFLRVSVMKGEIEIKSIKVVKLENPDADRLKYKINNPKIKSILDATRNTFVSNAVDILTDCPSRERAGWLCDSYFTGRAETIFTGNNLVERNFLKNYANYVDIGEIPHGMLPMCYPSDSAEKVFIPNWAMFYGLELFEYFKKYEDSSLLEISLPRLKGLIEYFAKFENECGLLENLESWVFVEWSEANNYFSIQGVNLPTNMLYSEFLNKCGELLSDQTLKQKSERIRSFIRERGYNGEFFVDNLIRDNESGKLKMNDRVCETTQYYAFYFNVASKKQYPELFNKLINKFGPLRDYLSVYPNVYKSNTFIGDYLRLEILINNDLYKKVQEETIDFFYNMSIKTGTLWEHDSEFASLNHAFTSYVANIIIALVTGIKEIDYLNKTVTLTQTGFMDDYDINIPIKDEYIHVKQKNRIRSIELPCGYELKSINN